MLALLAEASVFIHLDPRGPNVRVPPWFKNQAQLVLQVGLNMAVPIPDLDVGEQAITCTLSFSRRPFYCSIPWKSVFGLVGEGGPGLVWPDDVPVEVAAQVQAQGQKQPGQKPQAKKPDAGRGRLRAVGSEPSPSAEAADEAPEVAPQAVSSEESETAAVPARVEVSPVAAVQPSAPTPAAEPAAALEPSGEGKEDTQSAETEPVQPLRAAPSAKPGAKRDLPPYLRIVK